MLIDNGTGQILGRGHHYQTELVIFIAISTISVLFISSIFISIIYQLFMSCFIPIPSHNIRSKPSKRTNHSIKRCYFTYSFYTVTVESLVIVVNHLKG